MAEPPVPIKNLRLLDVKLGQLPTWIASLNYTPRAFLESCKRGHNRFYSKYWEPKRCGISGPAMLITAYVVFSYYLVYDRLNTSYRRRQIQTGLNSSPDEQDEQFHLELAFSPAQTRNTKMQNKVKLGNRSHTDIYHLLP